VSNSLASTITRSVRTHDSTGESPRKTSYARRPVRANAGDAGDASNTSAPGSVIASMAASLLQTMTDSDEARATADQ